MSSGNIKDIINDSTLTEFQTGQWYGNKCGKNIKKYADQTHTPVFMVRSGPSCPNCTNFYNNVLSNKKSFDAIANTNAIFLYYTGDNSKSHIQLTENDTKNIGKYTGDFYMCEDMRTYANKNKNTGKITYSVDYIAPWPRVVGYHNIGDGTIIMSKGIIQENDLVLVENKTNNIYGDSGRDIGYYISWFNKNYKTGYNYEQTTYSVTFYDYNNTILKDTQQVSANMDAIPPENPRRDNYNFIGWKPDYSNVTQNLSCYAQYKKIDNSNPITKNFCFGLNGNCKIMTQDGCVFQYDYASNQIYLKK